MAARQRRPPTCQRRRHYPLFHLDVFVFEGHALPWRPPLSELRWSECRGSPFRITGYGHQLVPPSRQCRCRDQSYQYLFNAVLIKQTTAMQLPNRPIQPHPALQFYQVITLGTYSHDLSRSTDPEQIKQAKKISTQLLHFNSNRLVKDRDIDFKKMDLHKLHTPAIVLTHRRLN